MSRHGKALSAIVVESMRVSSSMPASETTYHNVSVTLVGHQLPIH